MKKNISCIFFLIIPLFKIFAQENYHSIIGTLESSVQSQKTYLSDELVYLFASKDSTLVKTEFTNIEGKFEFKNQKPGLYYILVKNLNFQLYKSSNIDLIQDVNLGNIILTLKETTLLEVSVEQKKAPIERSAGKMTINVENSLQATGSSAFEIIEKSPGVSVSMTDQISLNGKQGITVQINGKSLQMSGSDLANYLRGIPSSSIEKIEFLTNPSSKYDAAGSLIIDIKLKKDTRFGSNGSITSSYGQGVYLKSNSNLNFNHRTKKLNFFLNYSFAYRKAFNDLELQRQFFKNDTFQLSYKQKNYLVFPFKNHIIRTGFDFTIDSLRTLSLNLNGVSNRFNPTGTNIADVLDQNNNVLSSFNTQNNSSDKWFSGSVNLNYNRLLDTLNSSRSIDLDYAKFGNNTQQNFQTRYYGLTGEEIQDPYLLQGKLLGDLDIYSIKFDQNKVFKNSNQLEFGIKSSFVEADNNLNFNDISSGTAIYDTLKSNHFIYSENINAAYLNTNLNYKKYSFNLGLRFENTNISGKQIVKNQSFDSSYFQLFPSLSIRYSPNEKNSFDFNLNRRIDRPSYDQLNPFKFYLDPTTYRAGNPFLKPQTTYTGEFAYTFKNKYFALFGVARTYDNITEVISPSLLEENITIQTNVNLKHVDLIYANFSFPVEVSKWYSFRIDLNSYVALYNGNVSNTSLNNVGTLNGNMNFSNTFQINKNHSLELSANYRTRELYGFDSIQEIYFVNLAYQAKILKNKGNIRVNFTDMFFTNQIIADVSFSDYKESFVVKRETRVCTIAFTYRFGTSQNQQRRRTGGAEELKQRVGNQGNG